MGMERDFTFVMNDAVCRWCFTELYTWSLHGFINQCHPNNLIKKELFTMKRDDASLSPLYVLTIKYYNRLKKPEVIGSDMANTHSGHFCLC